MLLREHVVDWLSGFWDITRIILAEQSGERGGNLALHYRRDALAFSKGSGIRGVAQTLS